MAQILIAEDHEDTRELLTVILKEKLPGYEVVTVKDGLEAWLWLANHTPDIVVLNMIMPKMSGMELFHAMRQNDRLKDVPIIALTGIRLPYGEGFCRVLMKPIKFENLIKEIENCITKKSH